MAWCLGQVIISLLPIACTAFFPLTEETPDHSSLTRVRDRLPLEVHTAPFQWVLTAGGREEVAAGQDRGGRCHDSGSRCAMKPIVRRDTGEDWNDYLGRLLKEQAGSRKPMDEELRRFDKPRKDKRVSNEEWMSETDPDSRIHESWTSAGSVRDHWPLAGERRRSAIAACGAKEPGRPKCRVVSWGSLVFSSVCLGNQGMQVSRHATHSPRRAINRRWASISARCPFGVIGRASARGIARCDLTAGRPATFRMSLAALFLGEHDETRPGPPAGSRRGDSR